MEEKSQYMPPILNVTGGFITARIAMQQNERLARKMDAAKFLDEANEGLWDLTWCMDEESKAKEPSFKIRKRQWDNQAFHFKDEQK